MKKYLILLLLYPFLCFGQDDSFNFEQNVNGVLTTSEGIYLILEQGFMQINKVDIYTEYYRHIYNDSTLINPNTELKSDFSLNIVPFIIPEERRKIINFSEPQKIGVFIHINDSGQYNLTSRVNAIIDSLGSP